MEKIVVFGGPIYECLTQFDRGEPGSFDVIIDQLKDPDADYRQLNRLILEIKKCAPLLTKQHVKMLRTLLGMGWGDFPDQILNSWLTTVQAVVTSQPVHLRPTLSSLVNVFRG